MSNSSGAHWRDTARRAKFFFVDAVIVWPIMICLASMSVKTLTLVGVSAILLIIMERYNFTLMRAYRYMFVCLAGPIRYRRGWWI